MGNMLILKEEKTWQLICLLAMAQLAQSPPWWLSACKSVSPRRWHFGFRAKKAAAVNDSHGGGEQRSPDAQLRARASVHTVAALQHVTFDRHLEPRPRTPHIAAAPAERSRRWRVKIEDAMGACEAFSPSPRQLPASVISDTRVK